MEDSGLSPHNSYFWNCLTMKEDCPFFSTTNPALYYFGAGLLGLYGTYFLMILLDLYFHWQIDEMQQQINFYINLISDKVKVVQNGQGRLMSMQERTEKQLQKSRQGVRMLEALRGAVARDDMRQVCELVKRAEKTACDEYSRNFPTLREQDIYSEHIRRQNNL